MALNPLRSRVLLTVIIRRRASIIPSIMYKLLVNPPAHRGPRMVARPPTERLTPWLKPVGENITRNQGVLFDDASVFLSRAATSPWVFSDVTLEKRDT